MQFELEIEVHHGERVFRSYERGLDLKKEQFYEFSCFIRVEGNKFQNVRKRFVVCSAEPIKLTFEVDGTNLVELPNALIDPDEVIYGRIIEEVPMDASTPEHSLNEALAHVGTAIRDLTRLTTILHRLQGELTQLHRVLTEVLKGEHHD